MIFPVGNSQVAISKGKSAQDRQKTADYQRDKHETHVMLDVRRKFAAKFDVSVLQTPSLKEETANKLTVSYTELNNPCRQLPKVLFYLPELLQ